MSKLFHIDSFLSRCNGALVVSHCRYGGGFMALIGYSIESSYNMIDFVTDGGDAHEHLDNFRYLVKDYPISWGNTLEEALSALNGQIFAYDKTKFQTCYEAEAIFLEAMKGNFSQLEQCWKDIQELGYKKT